MALKVFCAPNWKNLEASAIQIWHQSDGKATVIVPSSMLRNWWLSRLAEEFGGVHGNVVTTLERFAEQIAQKASQTLFRLARPLELKLAAWDAFLSCDVPETWRVSGIIDVFLNALEELELHGLTPEKVSQALSDDRNIKTLTELWQHWRKVLHERNLWTVGDVLQEGAKATEHLNNSLPSEAIVYGFTALTDLRWQFLQALQKNGVQTMKFFVLTSQANEQAYRYTQDLLQLLKSHGAEICEVVDDGLPSELHSIIGNAFNWQKEQEQLQLTDRIVCIAAAGEEQEVEMAIRILTKWRREGKLQRYSNALMLVRSLDKYLQALEAVSARYGVRFSLLSESGEPAYGLQRLLIAIAQARKQGLDGERLWQILPSPYLQVDGEPLLPIERQKETLKLIRQNIVETDIERWVERLSDNGKFAQRLREFLNTISNLPTEATAKEHAIAWHRLLDKFVVPESGNEKESESLRRVREMLNSLMAWSTNLQLDEIAMLLVESCRFYKQTLNDAVQVASVDDGRGLWSPVILILGLNDEEFPQTPLQFELLTDKHRERLQQSFGLLTPLRFRSRFTFAERILFMEAIGSATKRLVLTYRRTDSEGKPQASSVFLSAVENGLKASGWQWHLEERDLGDVLPRNLSEAIDQRDAEKLAVFCAFIEPEILDEKGLAAKVLRETGFRQKLHSEWQRWNKPQQGFEDGNLPSLSNPIVAQLQANGLRLTALEDYGDCPYKFFARHILNLQRPQDVTYTVDHRTIGILWHEIMAKFLENWRQQGDLPDEKTLQNIAECVVNTRLANYPEKVRDLIRQQVLSATGKVWQAEEKEKEKGWHSIGSELALQFNAEKLGDVPDRLKPISISLKIDRIDEGAEGQLRVADYKTGSIPIFKDIENGVALQLPLYAFAVGEQVAEAIFLKLLQFTQNGYRTGCHLVQHVGKRGQQRELREMQEIAIMWARSFLVNIAEADFTVRPFKFGSSCKNCDFKALCRHSKLRLTERESKER